MAVMFLSTDKGEITFGTVRDGNVFLNDSKGVTTGTIRNGNVFLQNSDGSNALSKALSSGMSVAASNNSAPISPLDRWSERPSLD